jgi:hypothetical protein
MGVTPDLSSECTGFLEVAVLSCDFDVFAHNLLDLDQVDGRWGDNDLCFIDGTSQFQLYDVCLPRAPVLGSNSALFKPPIRDFLASRVVGLSVKFPPTKNWRVIVKF